MSTTQQIAAMQASERPPRQPGRARLWTRIIAPLIPLVVIVLVAVFATVIAPYSAEKAVGDALAAPSPQHLFGTDSVGLDVFSRVIVGMQISVKLALIATVVSTVVGILFGTVIGLAESKPGVATVIGQGLNRLSDYIISVPSIILGIVVVGLMGPSQVTLVFALSIYLLQAPLRLTRVEVLRVRKEPYLEAASMAGEGALRRALGHVLPNSMTPALAYTPVVFGNSIVVLASLGFLGVGVQPPTPEWGAMISTGISQLMSGQWWCTVFPSVFLFLTVIGVAYSSRALPRSLHTFRSLHSS